MTGPTVDLAAYVETVAARAINDEDWRWREQAALWRSIAGRHGRGYGKYDWCAGCGGPDGRPKFPCTELLAVVAAVKAYGEPT